MDYESLRLNMIALCSGVKDEIANLANISALINENLSDINWVGFYLLKNDELVLGPFQGRVACTNIKYGKGVCGTCLKEDKTILVKDVHAFPGHIACDYRSNSEIVIPLHKDNKFYGVLDIDSEMLSRFNETDQKGLESIAKAIEEIIK